jgi:hypothetical protein
MKELKKLTELTVGSGREHVEVRGVFHAVG